MRAVTLAALLLAPPAIAQEEGRGLVERGVETVMRELLREMAPALRDMQDTMSVLEGVIGEVERYEAPELLPNGDIIIRRRRDLGPEPSPEGEIEL